MKLDGVVMVPVEEQLVAPLLAQWSANKPYIRQAGPGEFGGSSLGDCARALGYSFDGVPKSNPPGEGGLHAMGLGSLIHLAIQEEGSVRPLPGTEFVGTEIPWRLALEDGTVVASDGDVGLRVLADEGEELVEIKSAPPFGFMKKVGEGEGPERSWLLQCGMGARALRAQGVPIERVRIVCVATSALKGRDQIDKGDKVLDGRANRYAEWVAPLSALDGLLDEELERLAYIRALRVDGREVPRFVPGHMPRGARVVNPKNGLWQLWVRGADDEPTLMDTGSTWRCGYCDWADVCVSSFEAGEES